MRLTTKSDLLIAAFLILAPASFAGTSTLEHPAIRAWLDAWSTGNESMLATFLTEDTVLREPTLSSDDLDGYRRLMRIGLSALRNVEFTAEDLILDGARGAMTWTASAIHNGSGNDVRLRGASVLHFRDGKIAEEWRVYDRAALLRQIGVWPDGDGDGVTAELPDAWKPLRRALTLHSSFDAGADADFARGDRRIYTMTRHRPLKTEAGLTAEHVTVEATGGRYGGALRFHRPNEQILLYEDAENLGYDTANWNGTVSLWLRLDPDRDLTPGLYCDPIHITDATAWDDASMWLTFARSPPWRLAFGATPDLESWNPEGKSWSEIPDRPRVRVQDPIFSKDKWTHVAFTFSDFNRDGHEGIARLYIDGELEGEIRGRPQRHTWDPTKAAIQFGLNYVGRYDDLAVFDRALDAAEIETLFALPDGVVALHAGPPSAVP